MGEYASYSTWDPVNGARISTGAPTHPTGSFLEAAAEQWTPPADLVSAEPADPGYETGEEPSHGPQPSNIIGEHAFRGYDGDEWDDVDGRPSDTDGDEGDEFDGDDLDGDDDPADCPDLDCDESSDELHGEGPVPDNIVVDRRGLIGGSATIPGPLSRSRM